MPHIAIISSSVRIGRNSHRVALYFNQYLQENNNATSEILDLKEYNFPLFDERLSYMKDPSADVLDFAKRIRDADGVILVTPEYNGGYPASVKNIVDLLYDEWHHKPIAITTVSDGVFGGTQVIISIQWTLWKIRAWTVTAMFPVRNVATSFDENGVPAEKESTDKRAKAYLEELLWTIEAHNRMKDYKI
ncbi:MAG: NAD(P)H-dependent oxidoreductase [Bacteroidota bacterium]|nr:NAD(P)H-dependent oxidoreductase [Bacteroidota bacterium]